jgi:hypothetical protein
VVAISRAHLAAVMPPLLFPAAKTLFLSHFPPPPSPTPRLQLRRTTATATAAGDDAAASGTTARERRLAKVREERRRRDYDRQHTYPGWARSVGHLLTESLRSATVFHYSVCVRVEMNG